MLEIKAEISFPGFYLDVEEFRAAKGTVALFGPSGAGKSTLLRIAAGMESRARGSVCFGGECWQDSSSRIFVPPHERGAVLVFQDSRLFPHLDVTGNLRYGMKRRKGRAGPDWNQVRDALQLDSLLGRQVGTLSGGEKQRVALGRALLAAPRLLLLDEPMSALDADRRDALLPELAALLRRFDIPAVCVTHSADELRALGSAALEMSQGRIVSRTWPAEKSRTEGIPAIVTGRRANGLSECRLGGDIVYADIGNDTQPGDTVAVSFDPRHAVLATQRTAGVFSFGQIKAELLSAGRGAAARGLILRLAVSGVEITLQPDEFIPDPELPAAGQTLYLILTRPAVASHSGREPADIA